MKILISAILIASTLVTAFNVNAHFIRPYVQLGAVVNDGLDENGATSGQELIGSSLQSIVDLNDGTVKTFLDITGQGLFGQSVGIFGDTLTFSNNTGSDANVDISFTIDGGVDVTGVQTGGTTGFNGQVAANLLVFDTSAGATSSNFLGLNTALIDKVFSFSTGNLAANLSVLINETLSAALTVGSGVQSYDVFARISTNAAINSNPISVKMDFLNTGTFGIGTPQDVTYSSQSGVFLNSQPAVGVPVPSMYILITLGLLVLIVRRRMHKQQ